MSTNRLIHEKSPYLLQHAHNPVDWYPWNDDAFQRARHDDKPIFLSVGYATCHWCHVMERETFEDEEAAQFLNQTFVCIKVDREERPDIDAVYMASCQMLTGSGGWPLTIMMTPDKHPFFAATYMPKHSRFGRPGVMDLCERIDQMWRNQREKIMDAAMSVSGNLNKQFQFESSDKGLDESLLSQAFDQLERTFDTRFGGFGGAPKFPTPHRLLFLLHRYQRTQQNQALEMVKQTLTAMRLGGIWDHVGFGFHRYATDIRWFLPHFEKMLYDQALMTMAYIETFRISRESFFSDTASEILSYVLRDMTSSEGGFFSAQDADSEGEEGKFYVWRQAEFRDALKNDAYFWSPILNIKPSGNYAEEASGMSTGTNILHLTSPLSEWAKKTAISPEDMANRWEIVRQRLYDVRSTRIPPLKDDKILTDWNGLMITAFARASQILENREYGAAAERSANFILERMTDANGKLLHRYRDGNAGIIGNANDYAFFIMGLLELYACTHDSKWIEHANRLQDIMIRDFWDSEHGGFFLASADGLDLPVRPKELHDGAIPSANSVALTNLLTLSKISGNLAWDQKASDLIHAFSETVRSHPFVYTWLLMGIDMRLDA